MTNLLNYFICKYSILYVNPNEAKKGKGIGWYILGVGTQIIRKYHSDQQLKAKDEVIRQKELELSTKDEIISNQDERIKVLEEKEKIYGENNDYVTNNIETPTFQELRNQNTEIRKLLERKEELLSERVQFDMEQSNLSNEGDNLRRSLDNNESVPQEVIESFRQRIRDNVDNIERNIDFSNTTIDKIRNFIENYKSGNKLIDYNDLFETVDPDLFVYCGGVLFITWCLFSILNLYLGNYLIERFNLGGKYFWLDKMISYRQKFFNFSIYLNLFYIVLILIMMLTYYLV